MVFTGTYKRALDGKLRVLLPKRLRSAIPDPSSLFLTPGTDRCLELHTTSSLHELGSRASASSASSKNVRSFSRLFYARAEQCDIDKQGRIRIPSSLAQLADIETEVTFIGVGSHWELWNDEQWESYLEQHRDEFDEIAQTTFDPPVDGQSEILGEGSTASEDSKTIPR
ncbi:MAG: division/cell wall cluster transcriptional repressor MraZ [Mariniblastus sp.]